MRALGPRGPDGGGVWSSKVGRDGVALASALRRATPEDDFESQPATNHDGSVVLVADMRLDNREELAASLGLRVGARVPDSALVISAYERWGSGMLDHIVGEFALALADVERGGLFLARDQVGARPLVIHEGRDVFAFASTALALTAFRSVPRDLDLTHAGEILAMAFGSERTFVKDVRWLPAGDAVWLEGSRTSRWTWWKADPHETVDLGNHTAHVDELRSAFDVAVEARLRSKGQVGAGVSGGLDSTSAAATAASLLAPERLRSYTAVPPPGWRGPEVPGWDADETPLVRALAEMYANLVPAFVHPPRDTGLFDVHEALWRLGAGPAANPMNMLWMHAIRKHAGSDGVTSLLGGDMGNLFFSADSPSRGSSRTLLQRVPRPIRRRLRTVLRRPGIRERWLASSALRPEVASELNLEAVLPQVDERKAQDGRLLAYALRHHYAGQADVTNALTALTGVEPRDPTSDRRVLDVAMRQPDWVRGYEGVTRAAARAAMAGRLPP
ncbi:MAG TPA: asparagine synthase-related protein, partial [Rubellimicrobium sp.]|nr:asparagine synthase-related protein [Rubellimicrobium sp.]